MYNSRVGSFCSRDPGGYPDGANAYAAYFGTSGTDPSGLCEEPWESLTFGSLIDKTDVFGMPWHRANLSGPGGGDSYGLTYPTVTADCNCQECCDGWQVANVTYDVDIKIYIDLPRIMADGGPWDHGSTSPNNLLSVEGTYGHEQRHVMHMMDEAENLFSGITNAINEPDGRRKNFGEGLSGQVACITACSKIRKQATIWRKILATEAGHSINPYPAPDSSHPPLGTMPGTPAH